MQIGRVDKLPEESPYSDQYIDAVAARETAIRKATTWRLTYVFRIYPDCELPESIRLADCRNSTVKYCNHIDFRIDNKTGIVPSLASATAIPIGAFSISGNDNDSKTYPKTCPALARATPQVSNDSTISKEAQARMSASLMNLTSCAGYSWPNISIQSNCEDVVRKSGGSPTVSPFTFNTATYLGALAVLLWIL
jgi:hypothetical protein